MNGTLLRQSRYVIFMIINHALLIKLLHIKSFRIKATLAKRWCFQIITDECEINNERATGDESYVLGGGWRQKVCILSRHDVYFSFPSARFRTPIDLSQWQVITCHGTRHISTKPYICFNLVLPYGIQKSLSLFVLIGNCFGCHIISYVTFLYKSATYQSPQSICKTVNVLGSFETQPHSMRGFWFC